MQTRDGPIAASRRARALTLADIHADNERLYRAYLLKESLARALDYLQLKRTRQALEAWLDWACHSKVPTFVTLLRTVRKHKEGILA